MESVIHDREIATEVQISRPEDRYRDKQRARTWHVVAPHSLEPESSVKHIFPLLCMQSLKELRYKQKHYHRRNHVYFG
jgi:hypothetical protein